MAQIKALNVAVVGSSPGCKAIIDMACDKKFSQLRMNLIGIACTDTKAEGYRYAKEKGIYTTIDYLDFYKIKDLDMIIELTGSDEVAKEILKTKPDHVRLIDHVTFNLFWDVFRVAEENIAALKKAEEKYTTVIESPFTGIFIHQDGKYVFVNDKFAKIHGYTSEELLGMEFSKLIHPDEREYLINVALQRIDGETVPQRYEVRRLGKDGRTIWCEMMATRIEYRGRPAVMGNIIDISERKRALAAVQQRDETLSGIIASMADQMTMLDNEYNIVWANFLAKQLYGQNLVGKKCYSVYHGYDKPCEPCVVRECFEYGVVHEHEREYIRADGSRFVFWCTASVAGWHSDGRAKLVVEIARDITERKKTEDKLRETVHQQQLAYDQAIIYGEQLNKQISVRKQAEYSLHKRKEELKVQARNLEEMNAALKVLLKHREKDKAELEEKVLANVKELILPFVKTLQNTRLGAEQLTYINIIDAHLKDIISPFLRNLSSKYLGLTPKEIQVASLIKEGKTTKEIAGLLNSSVRAVEFHRENIRAKFGLKNKKANLRSYLLTLQ